METTPSALETTPSALVASNMATLEVEVEGLKDDVDDDGRPCRRGNVWTAAAHIITAVIGTGVLSLSWANAQLGWIAGLALLVFFAGVTLYTSRLLADCYRSPHPVTGDRNYVYMDAVKANLSRRAHIMCGVVQYTNLIGTCIGYTITAASSARAIQKTNCLYKNGESGSDCSSSTTLYIILFGVVQAILSQIPNFGDLWWLSYLAATMSCTYSTILLALGIAKTTRARFTPDHDYGSITGVPIGPRHGIDGQVSKAMKVWNCLTALGDMAFAYAFSVILLEVADTLKSSPPENRVMKMAAGIGISVTTFYYLSISIFGYAAFGNSVKGNLLTGFTTPYWLVDFANACVIIHLIGAVQVFVQPVYQFVELSAAKWNPNSTFITKEHTLRIPFTNGRFIQVNLFRLIWRTIFIILSTVIAMLLPFFNDVMGILGALGFWPLTVYFPIQVYINQFQVRKWSKRWIGMQLLSLTTLVISVAALVGSVVSIYIDLKGGIKLFAKD